jgi:hypothetical protein
MTSTTRKSRLIFYIANLAKARVPQMHWDHEPKGARNFSLSSSGGEGRERRPLQAQVHRETLRSQ